MAVYLYHSFAVDSERLIPQISDKPYIWGQIGFSDRQTVRWTFAILELLLQLIKKLWKRHISIIMSLELLLQLIKKLWKRHILEFVILELLRQLIKMLWNRHILVWPPPPLFFWRTVPLFGDKLKSCFSIKYSKI